VVRLLKMNERIIQLTLIAFLLGATLWACLARVWRARRRQRIAKRAQIAEKGAVSLLSHAGYAVVDYQPRTTLRVLVDGRPKTIAVQADYLVSRGRKRYVAEVKSGKTVREIDHGPTRRQLLEYRLAYRVHGVLLVDTMRRRVRHVAFDFVAARGLVPLPVRLLRHAGTWLFFAFIVLLGITVTYIIIPNI